MVLLGNILIIKMFIFVCFALFSCKNRVLSWVRVLIMTDNRLIFSHYFFYNVNGKCTMGKPLGLGAAYPESLNTLIYSFMELRSRNSLIYCGHIYTMP